MRRILSALGLLLGLLVAPAFAETLPAPKGEAVLTVSGDIVRTNAGDTAVFDMEMLTAMPAISFETTTLWTEGVKTFKGVALADLLDMVGVQDGTIRALAINDYAVEIPVDSLTASTPIVAYEMDGAPMPRRQKGPLWIVYPYDSDVAYQTEVIYSRSIWQLDRLVIQK